jgi:hypothetical protein
MENKSSVEFENANIRVITSTCIRRLFFCGPDVVGIEKMRSKFFQRGKSSAGAGTLPAGSGGRSNKVKRGN